MMETGVYRVAFGLKTRCLHAGLKVVGGAIFQAGISGAEKPLPQPKQVSKLCSLPLQEIQWRIALLPLLN